MLLNDIYNLSKENLNKYIGTKLYRSFRLDFNFTMKPEVFT
jgi:hypothetical protein